MMPHPQPNYTFKAVLRKVVDGDTFKADIDQGFGLINTGHKGRGVSIRVYGIDCPDVRYGATKIAKDAATQATYDFLHTYGPPIGKGVFEAPQPRPLVIVCHKWDSWGRAISTVYAAGQDKTLAQYLLDTGNAVPYAQRTGRKK